MNEKINNLITSLLKDGQVLMDVSENIESGFVRIVVDSESSITLDDTASLTKCLKNSAEFLNRYPDGCRIEVTTPGLGYPLKYPFQFKKNVNRKIDISFEDNDQIESMKSEILSANNNNITVKYKSHDKRLLYTQIITAKVLVSFK
mgnify:CR=1 FL=1